MALKLYPYMMASESARDLSNLLNVKRVRDTGRYIPKRGDIIVGWGNGTVPSWMNRAQNLGVRILNNPSAVSNASNKLRTFQILHRTGVSIPEFTTQVSVAELWLRDGETVIERHKLQGKSGEGIRVVNLAGPQDPDDNVESVLRSAPLYTQYIPKTAEFRVHVFNGQVIDYVQKKKINTASRDENFNEYISSTEHGWIFARQDILEIPKIKKVAIQAVSALGLDFGAVDIIYNRGNSYVLEVNTSPGLAGTTLVNYGNALRRLMGLGNLPESVTQNLIDQVTQTPERPIAANSALVNRTRSTSLRDQINHQLRGSGNQITLQVDRNQARRLRSLLADL